MNTKKAKRVSVALLGVLCAFAVFAAFSVGGTGKVKASEAIYSQDFESLSTSLSSDEVYQNSGWAGGARSIVQSTGAYIKAPYRFFDNGCQNGHVYTDTNRCVSATEEGKSYTLTMRIKPYGDYKNLIFAVQGAEPAKYNSVIMLNVGQAGYAENYADASFVTVNSAEIGDDGWYDVNATVKGTGGYIIFIFYMNVEDSRYAEINEAGNTGFCLESFKFADGETAVYEMNISAGLSGNDAIFGACGLAGFGDAAVTEKVGINGKTLRAKLDFWPTADGGWQKEGLYFNENVVNIPMQEGKTYYVEYALRPFGKVGTTCCLFQQVGAENLDSQVILNADKTYSVAEYKDTKIFEDVTVKAVGDVFYVSAAVKGLGKPFKLEFRMGSSDADAANAGADTGFYIDDISVKTEKAPEVDPTEGEYKTLVARNFDNDPLDVSGSDQMYHTNGFAGVGDGALTIKENGINDTRCLSAMFVFFDDGWQKANLYIDSGKLGNTESGKIYRWDMKIKPVGSVDYVYIGIQSEKAGYANDYVRLENGNAVAEVAASGSKYIKHVLNGYEDGVYDVTIYIEGNGGFSHNFFNVHCTDPATANAELNTGILLEDYSISVKREAEPAGFNVINRLYNSASGKDVTVNSTFADIASVKADGADLAADAFSFENGKFVFKANYLKTLSAGAHEITATNAGGEQSVLTIVVEHTPTSENYSNDFSKMPNLNGDQEANDEFFRNSWFDPANYAVYTEGEGENRVIKFVPKAVDAGNVSMFQTNPNEGRMHCLTKGNLNTLSVDFKPLENSVITVRGLTHDATADAEFFVIEIDLKTGERISGSQNANVCYDVTAKEDGWYRLSVSFRYLEDNGIDSYAYVQFFAAAPTLGSVWYMDNFTVETEVYPEVVSSESRYDVASSTRPYVILALNGFEIVSVKEGETVLVAGTDYTLEVTPSGSYRLDLTETFCEKYALNDEKTITITTTKKDVLFDFTVVDTAPVMAETASCDLAYGENVEMAADLKGYEIALVTVDGKELTGNEYLYNAEGKFVLKYNYLKSLSAGDHTFVVRTSSGAEKTITVTISDSTPVFEGGAVYEKESGTDYTVKLNVFGKDITKVELGGVTLTESDYSYAGGVLTVKAAVFADKIAGKYVLAVTTVGVAELEIDVRDVPPVIEGEYEVAKGEALVLNVNLYGRTIVSIMAGELALTESDYSYENGVLTINAEVLSELAEGAQTITLVTSGGTATKEFTLKGAGVAPAGGGCGSAIGGGSMAIFALSIFAAALIKRFGKAE